MAVPLVMPLPHSYARALRTYPPTRAFVSQPQAFVDSFEAPRYSWAPMDTLADGGPLPMGNVDCGPLPIASSVGLTIVPAVELTQKADASTLSVPAIPIASSTQIPSLVDLPMCTRPLSPLSSASGAGKSGLLWMSPSAIELLPPGPSAGIDLLTRMHPSKWTSPASFEKYEADLAIICRGAEMSATMKHSCHDQWKQAWQDELMLSTKANSSGASEPRWPTRPTTAGKSYDITYVSIGVLTLEEASHL